MYIPLTLLGTSGDLCISSSGGDEISYLVSGSDVWKVHAFTTPGNHTYQIHSGSAPHRLVVVGGGGGGGLTVDLDRFSGGGGAGGFLFLDNLPMSSGSYNLFVGEGGDSGITPNGYAPPLCAPSTYDLPFSNNGQSSSFDYRYTPTSTDEGYYIPNSKLSAYGGGRGSSVWRTCPNDGTSKGTNGGNGASGGGGSRRGDGTATAKNQNPGIALYNLTDLPPHGFDGGPIVDTDLGGSGGGGASTSGSSNDTAGINTGGAGTNLLSYIGLNQTVCVGGPGGDVVARPWNPPSYTSGSGGAAAKETDTTQQKADAKGRNGMVLVLHKVCEDELKKCTTYSINGGATGGTVTYIPCGGGNLISSSIDFDQQATICTYKTDDYPQSTGTVTLTQTGSCDTEIPITPVPTCDTGSGEQQYPTYIYNWSVPGKCYPTPSSCQWYYAVFSTITYTNREGQVVSFNTGFPQTTFTGQICAREFPAPTISCSEPGDTGTCSMTKTNLVCGYYCSGSV